MLLVHGDRDELIRVFENLIENALKYGAPGKRIDITLTPDPATGQPSDAIVAVRDYGPGIAPEVKPNVFDRFAAKGRAGRPAGAGLGLALVNRFIELHGGWVEIESAPDRAPA